VAYQAGDLLVRAVMFAKSGLPADTVVNDFAFAAAAAQSNAQLSAIGSRVDDFYNGGALALNKVGHYIGEDVDRAATHRLDYYRIAAGPIGSPIFSENWLGPVTPIANSNIPCEVAGVLSMRADYTGVVERGASGSIPSTDAAIDQGAPATHTGVTRPRARRRGRLFIGPLTTDGIDIQQPQPPLSGAFTAALRAAAVRMKIGNTATGNWSVWSRRDATLYLIDQGWTDNAPDTQRRRGFKATTRQVWGP
jgi:hypothetical protein